MMSRSQIALFISLVVWSLVVVKLYFLRTDSNTRAVEKIAAEKLLRETPPEGRLVTPPKIPADERTVAAPEEPVRTDLTAEASTIPPTLPPKQLTERKQPPASSPAFQSLKGRTVADYRTDKLPWMEFVARQHERLPPQQAKVLPEFSPIRCGQDVINRIDARLNDDDLAWCKWSLSPSGGGVIVGKSYGKLDGKQREKYEQLNCNAVAKGQNPSCNDAWGDNHITTWKSNPVAGLCGGSDEYSSNVRCVESANLARFCEFDNLLLDMSKMHNVKRPGRSDSRRWDPGFLSTHCDRDIRNIGYYELYAPAVDPQRTQCDFVFNESVVIYGHDDIHNLGHSMSDFMNVWTMLWLSGLATSTERVTFLNADAIRMGHNYYDDMGKLDAHYVATFGNILKLSSFPPQARVCMKHVVFMPRPLILYTWDGWWQDMKCSFVGPSSLYQRWNLQVRHVHGLLPHQLPSKTSLQILLIIRKSRNGSSQQASRVLKNFDQVRGMLAGLPGVTVRAVDLSELPFLEQVETIANSAVLVGMHGAGIASAMHMNLGGKDCCGVVEMFPVGEFQPIRGYGNMARKMGLHYERFELSGAESRGDGAAVNVDKLQVVVTKLLEKVKEQPSCVLPSVLDNPYFDKTH